MSIFYKNLEMIFKIQIVFFIFLKKIKKNKSIQFFWLYYNNMNGFKIYQ